MANLLIACVGCAAPLPTAPGPASYQAVADKTDWGWDGQEATIAASMLRAPGDVAIDVRRSADQPWSVESPLVIRVCRRGEQACV
jgi:hypothetical protein